METAYKYLFILVDDNAIDLMINARLLELSGMAGEIRKFAQPQEALHYIGTFSQNRPELKPVLLLDILMPEIDGFSFLQEIRSNGIQLPPDMVILMLSSTIDLVDQVRADEDPLVTRHLNKPLNIDELRSILHPAIS